MDDEQPFPGGFMISGAAGEDHVEGEGDAADDGEADA